tara:strand:- start:6398 stop:7822 length:1425 start_codon:yes stop_codon:yes gene_type:complete
MTLAPSKNEAGDLDRAMVSFDRIVELFGREKVDKFSQIKRFMEIYSGDDKFREEVAAGNLDRLSKFGVFLGDLHPNELIGFSLYVERKNEKPIFKEFRRYMLLASQGRVGKGRQVSGDVDIEYSLWRLEQINRGNFVFNKKTNNQIVHSPLCIELTKGCSVGCWFCGISADTFEGSTIYTEKEEMYNAILRDSSKLAGHFNLLAFLYWGTDPLDCPDYTSYLKAFAQQFGYYPQTTTAQASKYPEQAKNIVRTTNSSGHGTVNRFSILSKGAMYKIMREFTPFELANTLMVMQQPSSITKKASAGRAAEEGDPDLIDREQEYQQSTIACVSGFKINLATGMCALISPCESDDEFKDGFITYATTKLSESNSIISFFKRYIALRENLKLRLSPGISIEVNNITHEIRAKSKMSSLITEKGSGQEVALRALKDKSMNHKELACHLQRKGISILYVDSAIQDLLNLGVICHEPGIVI